MEQKLRCKDCGQELSAEDLNCWACGALTDRGRAQKLSARAAVDDDDQWRKSVEAARARKQEKPKVDPDQALEQVLAQQGMTDAVTRVATLTRAGLDSGESPPRDRTDYSELRDIRRTLITLAAALGSVLALLAVVVAAYSLSLLGDDDPLTPLMGFGAGVLIIVAAAVVYYMFRVTAQLIDIFADTADNTRRTVAALRTLQTELERVRAGISVRRTPDEPEPTEAAPRSEDAPS